MSVKLSKGEHTPKSGSYGTNPVDYNKITGHFHIGSNMPGFLPESDVFCAETMIDAIEYMLGELDRSQDLMAENCTAQDDETKEKGSDCCAWCSEFYTIEAIKTAYSDRDLQYKVWQAVVEHNSKSNKQLSNVFSYLHTPPVGADIHYWITLQVDKQEECLIYQEQEEGAFYAPHGEEQGIVNHMERNTEDEAYGGVYDPEDYPDYGDDDVDDDGCEPEILYEDNGDGTEREII